MNIALIGPGGVGTEFLHQLSNIQNVNLIGTISSKKMQIGNTESPANLDEFIHFCKNHIPCILIDATANIDIARQYPNWLQSGFHIVTPNKKAFSDTQELFDTIISTSTKTGKLCLHESSVGAGLPIISTLKDLVASGDSILSIEGIFSGTLSFIFNNFSNQQIDPNNQPSFSSIVVKAKTLGYTEPDPRDDLTGKDVARKIVILSRISGFPTSLESLPITSLVPKELDTGSVDNFLQQLNDYNQFYNTLNKNSLNDNKVLRYIGSFKNGKSTVELKSYPFSHPFAQLQGSDNIICFTTKRFPNGLIIQGSGAGTEVTAFGMISDVFKCINTNKL